MRRLRRTGLRSDDGWEGEGMRGYMAAKKRKLDEQFETDAPNQVQKEGTRSSIFNGVAIYVNGWTDPCADELRRLMQVHGGKYDVYPSASHTTHVIASNLPDRKIKDIKDRKVVRPQWITDSIKAGHLLSHVPYMLYKRDTAQASLNFRSLTKTSTTLINSEKVPMDEDFYGATDGVRPFSPTESHVGNAFHSIIHVDPSSSNKDVYSDRRCADRDDPFGNSYHGDDSLPTSVTSGEDTLSLTHNKSSFNGGEKGIGDIIHDNSIQEALCNYGNSSHGSNTIPNVPTKPSVTSPGGKKPMGSSKDANFVAEFYDNSRLHHLSTWRTEFQAYVNVLQGKGDNGFPGRQRLRNYVQRRLELTASDMPFAQDTDRCTLKPKMQRGRVIMHLDMDCFFVSVGLRNHPELRGKPVAVTHSKGKAEQRMRPGMDPEYERAYWENKPLHRHSIGNSTGENTAGPNPQRDTFMSMSEIASCSYEARRAGVKNGMFMGPALKLCPHLKTITYDFEGYKEVAQKMYDILASYTHEIEAVSCDEAFVDVTDILTDTGATPSDLATVLRQEILGQTQCPASVGLASSILLARMATKRAKPDGQFYLPPEDILDFVSPQMVRELPGVGHSLGSRLKVMGVLTCGDLQKVPLPSLQKEFGPKTGQALHRSCRGQDDRQLKVERERKSVSAEINYGIRFTKDTEAETFMYNLAEEVQRRLQKAGVRGKTVTVKAMARKADAPVEPSKFMGHGICDSLSKSSTLGLATDDPKVIGKEAWNVLSQMKLLPSDLRGLGIQITRLVSTSGATSSSVSNKSIMDFVKAKNRAEVQPSSTKHEVHTDVQGLVGEAQGSLLSKKTMLDFLRSKPSTSSNTEGVEEDVPSVGHQEAEGIDVPDSPDKQTPRRRGLPPLPALPTFRTPKAGAAVSGRDDGASTTQEDLYLPSPSQVDPSVLAALPADIRQQIEQTYTARNLPLRTLTEEPAGACNAEMCPAIDQSFLDALPADLRKDIEEQQLHKVASESAVSNRGGKKGSVSCQLPVQGGRGRTAVCPADDRGTSLFIHGNDDRACNNVTEEETPNMVQSTEVLPGPSGEGRRKKRDSGPIVALPDLNKLDPTCLDALPPELQQELKQAYAQQQKQQQPPQQQATHLQDALKLLGHSKGRPSPPKPKRKYTRRKPLNNSPSKKRPSSSPSKKRLSPQKLMWNQPRDNMAMSVAREAVQTSETPVPDPTPEEPTDTCNRPQVQQVNLCGRVGLPEVKALLQEWTHSCPAPEEEDVAQFVQYLHQLVLDRNLETVDLLIKYIQRLCRKLDTHTWGSAVEMIINNVQDVVEEIYGSKLKVV